MELEETLPNNELSDIFKSKSFNSEFGIHFSEYLQLDDDSRKFDTLLSQQKYNFIRKNFNIDEDLSLKSFTSITNDIKILKVLGKGSFAQVYKAYDNKLQKNFALKYVKFPNFSSKEFKNALQEILILKLIGESSPSFLKIHDFFLDDRSFLQTGNYNLIMFIELCQINLFEILKFRKKIQKNFSVSEVLWIIYSMTDMLNLLRMKNICHRDIKLDNILYSETEKTFKIADFSESKILTEKDKNDKVHTLKGTPAFLSPELHEIYKIHKGQVKIVYDPWKADMFSLGLCGLSLFLTDYEFLKNRDELDTIINKLNSGNFVEGVLLKMLDKNPDTRISEEELLNLLKSQNIDLEAEKNHFWETNAKFISTIFDSKETLSPEPRKIIKQKIKIAGLYNLLRDADKALSEYELGLEKIEESFKGQINIENEDKLLMKLFEAQIYSEIAKIHNKNLNFEEAQKFCVRAKEIELALNEKKLITEPKLKLIHFQIKQNVSMIDKNLEYLRKVEEEMKEFSDWLNGSDKIEEKKKKKYLDEIKLNQVILLLNLGKTFHSLKKFEESVPLYKKALEMIRNDVLHKSRYTLLLIHLSKSYMSLNKNSEAEACLHENLELLKKDSDYFDSKTCYTFHLLSSISIKNGNFAKASEYANEELNLNRKINQMKDNPSISFPLNNLAECALAKNEFENAENYLKLAYKINSEKLGQENKNTHFIIRKLIILYRKVNKLDEELHYLKMITPFQDSSDMDNNLTHIKNLIRIRDIFFEQKQLKECCELCILLETILTKVFKKKNIGYNNLINHLIFICSFYLEYDKERLEKRKTIIRSYLKKMKQFEIKKNAYFKSKYEGLKEQLKRINH